MAVSHHATPRQDPEPYDLVVTGGRLFDPATGTVAPKEVAVHHGLFARIGPPGSLAGAPAARTYEADGRLLTPGLVDLHAHVYRDRTSLGLDADAAGVEQGVTTLADAGSCGSDDWEHFARHVVAPARTRVLAWLNISRHGLVHGTRELAGGPGDIDAAATAELLLRHRPTVRGIKVRMSSSVIGDSGVTPLSTAKEVTARLRGELGRLPVMVHVGNAPPDFADVLGLLGEGDVVTHAFHGKPGGLFGGGDRPLPQVRDALDRGVRLDVGHGSSSFSFRTAERALHAGIRPFTAGTDIHRRNAGGPVHSLTTTLTKLLTLGLPLPDALACATAHPARVLGLEGETGRVQEGAPADLTVLDVRSEPVALTDAEGETRTGQQQLATAAVVRAGELRHLQPHRKALA